MCAAVHSKPLKGPVPDTLTLLLQRSLTAPHLLLQEMCYTHYMGACRDCGGDGTPENSGPCEDPLAALAKACLCESWKLLSV